ncbi:hypothetical protein H8356DRAFT_1715180 [Neocallimastix lanati (nom. inval.)]|jgi:hypothetical protein|uniref:Uncharacterized protein n=1 Tax=Neocallimastix californiae TaxID=1754190 RepID=A0A1Y2AQ81_9FUNG|nr:hypothetical protein H8356DRAFT_1715180 [Neocallimastix sp. JGI-2020a]ORY24738.1 hypothetical protein LY90DRAFT_675105 [Neocallimastix californiae]|eukprot:ORY24738.1 hypothetical protein LY90DRAFT_675105 [Neocallimastix californiae]
MRRIETNNYIFLFCFYGGISIIGLIKGLIILVPVLILSIFGFTGIALILLPHDVYFTYRVLLKTSIIGINLKFLYVLLLPLALVGWPILVLFLSICFSFIYSFLSPIVKTFDSDYELTFGGIYETFKEMEYYIEMFWDFNKKKFFSYLLDIERREVNEPFDINIIQIIIELFLACYGSVVGIIVLTPIWLIKLIPLVIRLYYIFIKWIMELSLHTFIMFSIFFIIYFCLIPAIGVSSILICVVYSLFGGIQCAIEGYKHNFLRGLICIWGYIYDVDLASNLFIFDKKYSCFPNCKNT